MAFPRDNSAKATWMLSCQFPSSDKSCPPITRNVPIGRDARKLHRSTTKVGLVWHLASNLVAKSCSEVALHASRLALSLPRLIRARQITCRLFVRSSVRSYVPTARTPREHHIRSDVDFGTTSITSTCLHSLSSSYGRHATRRGMGCTRQ